MSPLVSRASIQKISNQFPARSRRGSFLKLQTNTGLAGWGDGSGEWLSPIVRTTVHEWEDLLMGRDPLDVSAICDDIADRLPWKDGPVLGSAIAAVNMALYDIAGKALKVPVYRLLGGRKRDRIKVYNHGLNFNTVEEAYPLTCQHCI